MALTVALLVAVVLTPAAGRLAVRLGVVDRPGPLKVQDQPVPYLGGVAVFAAIGCAVATERPSVLVPLGLALVLGVADDILDLSVRVRVPGQLVVGACAAAFVPARGPVGAGVTVLFVVVLLNAVNLLDGLDGLASGVACSAAIGFAIVLDGSWVAVAAALAGALLGFLVWNRPPARIYLGDAGSYLIGTALAVLLARSWGEGEDVAVGMGSVLFVAVPVADTAIAIVRRLRTRRPLFSGDRAHVYDQLVDRGWPPLRVTVVCTAAQLGFVAIGVGIAHLPVLAATLMAGIVVTVVAALSVRTFARAV